jgi:hypothetical protein
MKHFIDLGIGIIKSKDKDIFRRTINTEKFYYIYKSYFWGLFKEPLYFDSIDTWKTNKCTYYSTIKRSARKFDTIKEYKELIKDIIKINPQKYKKGHTSEVCQ